VPPRPGPSEESLRQWTRDVVLFFHLLARFIGIGAGSILLACAFQLRAAQTLEDAVPWGVLAGKIGPAFPVAILGLFGTGAYMTSDVWTWDTGWIDVGIAGLVVLAVQGPLLAERTAKKVENALRENGPGQLGEHARRMTRHPGLWIVEFSNFGVVLAIVWNMTVKPGTPGSVAALVLGYAVGALLALPFTRPAAVETAPAAWERVTQGGHHD
jgi:uncharacterized membrane protein